VEEKMPVLSNLFTMGRERVLFIVLAVEDAKSPE